MLVVDDQADLRLVTGAYLRGRGHEVLDAGDARSARSVLARRAIDVVVLDLGLPDEDGLGLLRELRADGDVGVVVVTGRGDEADRVVGLELGADDYLVKPFSQRELAARIAAVQRRRRPADGAPILRFGALSLDIAARTASVDGRPVALTRLEYELLAFLARHPGRAYSAEQLLADVWDSSPEWQGARTVSEHVYRLRRKLGLEGGAPQIATVHGVGYRFDP